MNSLQIKDGALVAARHFDPPMIPLWIAILELSPEMEDSLVWITSGSDAHRFALHPNFRALDVRTKNIKAGNLVQRRAAADQWAARIRRRVGRNYDVIFEESGENPDKDHIHGEYDEKG